MRVRLSWVLGSLLFVGVVQAQEAYEWGHVPIGGGGYITGLYVHASDPDIRYARLDVAGPMKWNAQDARWEPLIDFLTYDEHLLYGVEGMAVDPNDPKRLWVAMGRYATDWDDATGDILRSTDGGETWSRDHLTTRDMGGNSDLRWGGERLVLDPNNGNVLYFATRDDGLYRSIDAGESYQKVPSLTERGDRHLGHTFVAVDPTATVNDRSATLYAGVYERDNSQVWTSTDGGETWTNLLADRPMPGTFQPIQGRVADDGTFWVTFHHQDDLNQGGVWAYRDGQWTDVSPEATGFAALAIDPNDAQHVIVCTYKFNTGTILYRSKDGGQSWTQVSYRRATVGATWWPDWMWAGATASLSIDGQGGVWYSDWYSVWTTSNLDDPSGTSDWHAYMDGLENTVVMSLKSPPSGEAALYSGIADVEGFIHTDLGASPSASVNNFRMQDITGIDFTETAPDNLYIVGGTRYPSNNAQAYYSTNGGRSWRSFIRAPFAEAEYGRIAASATDRDVLIWQPAGDHRPYLTTDRGRSWEELQRLPTSPFDNIWRRYQPLASDRVDGDVFYYFNDRSAPSFYRSLDGGVTWRVSHTFQGTNYWPYQHVVAPAPGVAGEVWVGREHFGLYRSNDFGDTFTQIDGVADVLYVSIGKHASTSSHPTVFIYGKLTGDANWGIHRSTDAGASWVTINDGTVYSVGNEARVFEADRRVFGRIFVGTGGSGIVVGQPQMRLAREAEAAPRPVLRVSEAYPNPARQTTQMTVTLPVDGPLKLTVYNVLGQVQQTVRWPRLGAGEHTLAVPLTEAPAGVYIVRVQAGRQHVTRRVTHIR